MTGRWIENIKLIYGAKALLLSGFVDPLPKGNGKAIKSDYFASRKVNERTFGLR